MCHKERVVFWSSICQSRDLPTTFVYGHWLVEHFNPLKRSNFVFGVIMISLKRECRESTSQACPCPWNCIFLCVRVDHNSVNLITSNNVFRPEYIPKLGERWEVCSALKDVSVFFRKQVDLSRHGALTIICITEIHQHREIDTKANACYKIPTYVI